MLKGGDDVFSAVGRAPIIGIAAVWSANPTKGCPCKGNNPPVKDKDPVIGVGALLNAGIVFIHIPAFGA
jgi:hypothetical protein